MVFRAWFAMSHRFRAAATGVAGAGRHACRPYAYHVRMAAFGVALWVGITLALSLHAAPIEQAFRERMQAVGTQREILISSAETHAFRLLDHPEALLNIPWHSQKTFCEEKINRAGGLAHAFPTENHRRGRRQTPHDVVLLSVRSWEEGGEAVVREIEGYREKGWLITLIASAADKPEHVAADFLIDNGAPDGGQAHGALNALVNSMLGWMWVCEYAAAMTRRGRVPAILRSVAYDDARPFNARVQTMEGRHTTFEVETAVEAGVLADQYYARIMALIDDVVSDARREQLQVAARHIRERMEAGRTVWLSGVGHMIEHEMHLNMRSGWKPLPSRRHFQQNLERTEPGDLVIWVGYIGMNSRHNDYETPLANHALDLITCYKPTPGNWQDYTEDPNVMRDAESALAHIDQTWSMGDAEVPIPGPVNRMGPISGINAMLLCRMLDENVARLRNQVAVPQTMDDVP